MVAVVIIGTNLGDRKLNLELACQKISERAGIIKSQSRIYSTEPWGNAGQDEYLNQVAVIETSHSPAHLLEVLLEIEKEMGRERKVKWEPRIVDIDILYYEDQIINTPGLKIPHPYISERRFVLVPLSELMPGFTDPEHRKSVLEMLQTTSDHSSVNIYGES